jgi:lambda family phage portal protein
LFSSRGAGAPTEGKATTGEALPFIQEAKATGKRSYYAGQINRLNADFREDASAINADIRANNKRVTNRARTLWKNNPGVRGHRYSSIANIIPEDGFTLQVMGRLPDGTPDKVNNTLCEEAFYEWCEKEYCTMAGIFDFTDLCARNVEYMEREGEYIIRKITNAPNKFGFSLDPIEIDALDETYNDQFLNGNVVVMGVEINQWKRPVAFWLRQRNLYSEMFFNMGGTSTKYDRVRVPAEEILFGFDPEFYTQRRGMSRLASVMLTIHDQQRYDKSAVMASTIGATQAFAIVEKKSQWDEHSEDDEEEDTELSITPGQGIELPYGKEIQQWDPNYPSDQYPSFDKAQSRKIAMGLGRSYNSYANDLEGVNFSSIRSGFLEERGVWRYKAKTHKDFTSEVYKEVLKYGILNGVIKIPYLQYNNYKRHKVHGVVWPWVDPVKDVQAEILAINAGLGSRTRSLRKQGVEFTDIADDLAAEQEIIEEKKLKIGVTENGKVNAGTIDDGNEGTESSKQTDDEVDDSGRGFDKRTGTDGRIISFK